MIFTYNKMKKQEEREVEEDKFSFRQRQARNS